jgi:regulatory protein
LKITKIERAKKNKLKVNIFLDGEYSFSVFEDVFLKEKITNGMDISDEFVQKIKSLDLFESNKHYLLNILSKKNYTEKELYNKLYQRKLDKPAAKKLIEHIKKMGFLNDDKYMKDYFEYLVDSKKYSKMEILFKMKMKFNDDEKIRNIEEWLKDYDERDIINELLKKKFMNSDEKKRVSFFARKGFKYDDISCVLKKFNKEE